MPMNEKQSAHICLLFFCPNLLKSTLMFIEATPRLESAFPIDLVK